MKTEPAEFNYDLFISYAQTDRGWIEGFLIDALEQAGVKYYSEDAFALGVPRLIEFERAIKQSKRTLLVLSKAYLVDTFGQFVDVLVNSYGMETATWPVIPLSLEPIELPARLSQLVRLDATTAEEEQKALARLCAELDRPVPGPPALPDCPYPGMVPFDEADSDRFFGREREVRELVRQLQDHPFVAVIGASGSGKSSLVRAGLIPALRKRRQRGAGEWLVRTIRPGAAPLATLMQALADIAGPHNPEATTPFSNLALPAGSRLLLLVDQFEETFTIAGAEALPFQQALPQLVSAGCSVVLTVRADFYADLMLSPLWGERQAHRFEVTPLNAAGLHEAIVQPADRVGVAIEGTLIERLIGDAAGEPGVLPLIQETLVLLWERLERRFLPMRAYEALVLTRSAYDGQHGAGSGLQVAIEGALVERLLADAASEPGVLPLIQETLVLLWEHLERRYLPMRAYDALVLPRSAYGGQDGTTRTGLQVAIAQRADAALASLTPEQQAIARRILLRLIQFGEGRADTRRQQPLGALRSVGDDPALFEATIQRLAENRLVTLSGGENHPEGTRPPRGETPAGSTENQNKEQRTTDNGQRATRRVDISHEALIGGWPALQGWLNERREAEQARRRLEVKASDWVRLGSGDGGLLDAVEVLEAERWLQSPDADEMGFDAALPELVVWSKATIEQAEYEKETARREREALLEARADAERERAEEQSRRAEAERQRAEEQRQHAEEQATKNRQLRRRAVFLGLAMLFAVLLAMGAVVFVQQSL
jgi:hypothetical protein